MIRLAVSMFVLLGAVQVPARAACNFPTPISVPDGSTATDEQMVAGKKAVTDYIAEIEAYQACLQNEQQALGDALTDEQKAMQLKRYNASVDAMHDIADRFNEQLKAFKAKKK